MPIVLAETTLCTHSPEQIAEHRGDVARREKGDAVSYQPTARFVGGLRSWDAPPGRDDGLDERARGLVAHGQLDRPGLLRTVTDRDGRLPSVAAECPHSCGRLWGPAPPAASPDQPCRPRARVVLTAIGTTGVVAAVKIGALNQLRTVRPDSGQGERHVGPGRRGDLLDCRWRTACAAPATTCCRWRRAPRR